MSTVWRYQHNNQVSNHGLAMMSITVLNGTPKGALSVDKQASSCSYKPSPVGNRSVVSGLLAIGPTI